MSNDPDPSEDAGTSEAPTVDDLVASADDPNGKKQKTGTEQAKENEELDPPA